jgi:hypothetical protein
VVFAVMLETGLNRTELGKLILAAWFVTKAIGVRPLTGLFGLPRRTGNYTLMLNRPG